MTQTYGSSSDDELFAFEFAEPLYRFVVDECFKEFCEADRRCKLSLAEFVYRYKRDQFRAYLTKHGYLSQPGAGV